jgi:Na+-transporting methylmalonyl-CoA/oxaloacetate decarboxylase gamma subunit
MSIGLAEEAVGSVPAGVKSELLGVGTSLLDAILGYLVVFIGLILLMVVVIATGKIMVSRMKKTEMKKTEAPAPVAPAVPEAMKELAPGSAGDVKLYDTDPRDAAMIMAIVADKLQKPLNELRFVSIKEVK